MEMIKSMDRSLIYCTTALVVSFGLFYAYAKYKLSYWSRRGVKTPPTHLIFGNFTKSILFKIPPAELLHEIYASADPDDPYIGFYIFHKPMLLLRNHNLIKQVMIKHFDIFPNRQFGSAYGKDTMDLQNLLSVMSQPIWKHLRAKLTPALTGQKVKTIIPLITQCTKPMLKYIDELPMDKDGWKRSQDILDISSRYVSNVLASLLYGIEENAFDVKDRTFFDAGLAVTRGFKNAIVFMVYFFIPDLIPIIKPFFTYRVKYFRKCFEDNINYREQTGSKKADLLDFMVMLKNGKQNPIFKFEGDNLLGQAVSFHIAGFETVATTFAWTIYELACHPEYQDTLYKEIKEYLSGKEITLELINDMTFLNCVVNETLRLYPPLPVTDRVAARDFELPETGLKIEKGTPLLVSINSTNQDPRYFEDALNFIPLREKEENKKFYESLAFGIGPRSCIGQRIGLIIAKIAIVNFVLNYKINLPKKNKVDNKCVVHLFNYPANGFNVNFKKREEKL